MKMRVVEGEPQKDVNKLYLIEKLKKKKLYLFLSMCMQCIAIHMHSDAYPFDIHTWQISHYDEWLSP